MDRLSNLPEEIVHHIMSFLSRKNTAKLALVSTNFKSLWLSSPNLDLIIPDDNIDFHLEQVYDFVFKLRPPGLSLQKFRFCMEDFGLKPDRNPIIDAIINYALQHSPIHFTIEFWEVGATRFNCSIQTFLATNTIRFLTLEGLDTFENVVLSSPVLCSLTLLKCKGIKTLKVCCDKLTCMHMDAYRDTNQIELVTPNLEKLIVLGVVAVFRGKPIDLLEDNLSSCKSIWLKHVNVSSEFLSRQNKLESLKLECCDSLQNLDVASSKLTDVYLRYRCSARLQKINLDSPNLISFTCKNKHHIPINLRDMHIVPCKSLTSITLQNILITDQWIENYVSHYFPALSDFSLIRCKSLKKFKLSHGNLKSMWLRSCSELLEEAEIDARNLDVFVCDIKYASKDQQPVRLPINSLHVKVELCLETSIISSDWYSYLRGVLSFFDHCRELKLTCQSINVLSIPDAMKESSVCPLNHLKNLKVRIPEQWYHRGVYGSHIFNLSEFVDCLLWLAPRPDILTIERGSVQVIKQSLKFEYSLPMAGDEEDGLKGMNSWRHGLKRVTIENFSTEDTLILEKYIQDKAMESDN